MRVLLTRPYEDAVRTATRLAELGHESLIAPVVEIAATSATLEKRRYNAVIATSAQAFRFGGASLDGLESAPLWTVGERTAREARARGWAHIERIAGDSSELIAALSSFAAERRWLYVAGSPRSAAIETAMKAQNKSLSVVVVYETRTAATLPTKAVDALRAEAIDVVFHFSARSAAAFVDLIRARGLAQAADRPIHIAISSRCAEPLAGFSRVRFAARPDETAMVEALLRRQSPSSPLG